MHLFPQYKTVTTPIDGKNYVLYIADTFEKRKLGLSGITYLPRNEGMLFVYDQPVSRSFTMKNTKFPLRIIFLDEESRVVGDFNAKAFQPEEVKPLAEFKYVIEILGK